MSRISDVSKFKSITGRVSIEVSCHESSKKVLASLFLAAAGLFCDSAAAQQAKLSDSHAEPPPARRKTLSGLTDSVEQLPPASNIPVKPQNFIDDFILGKMDRDKIPHAGLSTDTEFLRRVNLDLTGRLRNQTRSVNSSRIKIPKNGRS